MSDDEFYEEEVTSNTSKKAMKPSPRPRPA